MTGLRSRHLPAPPPAVRWTAAILGAVIGVSAGGLLMTLAPAVAAGAGGAMSPSNADFAGAPAPRPAPPLSVAAVLAPASGHAVGAVLSRSAERP